MRTQAAAAVFQDRARLPASSYALWPRQDWTYGCRQDLLLAVKLEGLQVGLVNLEAHWIEETGSPRHIRRGQRDDETDETGSRLLYRAKPHEKDKLDGAWRISVWYKKVVTEHLLAAKAAGASVNIEHRVRLVLCDSFLSQRLRRHSSHSRKARVHSLVRIQSSTGSQGCARSRSLCANTLASTVASSAARRHQSSATGATAASSSTPAPTRTVTTAFSSKAILRPRRMVLHGSPTFPYLHAIASEITPDLRKCLDYFVRPVRRCARRRTETLALQPPVAFALPLSPPPTPTPSRHRNAHFGQKSASPPMPAPKEEEEPDVLVLDDSDGSSAEEMELDYVVAGDTFRSPYPSHQDAQLDPFQAAPRHAPNSWAAKPRRPSQASKKGSHGPRQPAVTPKQDAALEDKVAALKAQLATLEKRLEARASSDAAASSPSAKLQKARNEVETHKNKFSGRGTYRWMKRGQMQKKQTQ